VEVFFGEHGWIPFDPTPPSDEAQKGWLGRLALYYDWFELVWSEWVINYDLGRQVTLAQNFQRASREWSLATQRYIREKRRAAVNWLKDLQLGLSEWPYARLAGVALLAGLLLAMRWRRVRDYLAWQWGVRFGSQKELTARLATLHYRQMLSLLARRGMVKPPGKTPQEFASSIAAVELAGPVGQLTALYESARFGARSTEASKMTHLLDNLKILLRSVKRL
jgi:hypothetical protein